MDFSGPKKFSQSVLGRIRAYRAYCDWNAHKSRTPHTERRVCMK